MDFQKLKVLSKAGGESYQFTIFIFWYGGSKSVEFRESVKESHLCGNMKQ